MARKSKKQIDKEKKESEENAAAVKQRTRRRIEDIMEQRAFDRKCLIFNSDSYLFKLVVQR